MWRGINNSNGKYYAPEVRSATELTHASVDLKKGDIYSLGITFLEIANATPLVDESFKDPKAYETQLNQRHFMLSNNYNADLHEVIKHMLDPNPVTRWDINLVAERLSRLTNFPITLVGRRPVVGQLA